MSDANPEAPKPKNVQIHLDQAQHRALKIHSVITERTMQDIASEAVQEWLDRHPPQ